MPYIIRLIEGVLKNETKKICIPFRFRFNNLYMNNSSIEKKYSKVQASPPLVLSDSDRIFKTFAAVLLLWWLVVLEGAKGIDSIFWHN